jgi:hypothetical protein
MQHLTTRPTLASATGVANIRQAPLRRSIEMTRTRRGLPGTFPRGTFPG